MHKSNVATHLYAIDATPARLRGGVGLSLHPTHWLISTQVFSLGLVFYYVWERKLPSVKGALNVDEHRAAINSGARPAFSRTPKAIRALIEKMWAFNPDDRASAASVSSFLEACTVKPSLTGLGVKAP